MVEDPADEPPWAMQLVVRVGKAEPPTHRAVCAAAAMAVVRLLTDPRAAEDGDWQRAVERWESGRIRKVTRRARGARWEVLAELPGVTVDHLGAQVRAFVPGPVSEVPPELAKLQVAGLDLADEDAAEPSQPPYAVVALNPQVAMSTGKAAAQSGHAAHLLLRAMSSSQRGEWETAGLKVDVVRPDDGRCWRDCLARANVAVRDAGFTEVPPGTVTAVSWLATT